MYFVTRQINCVILQEKLQVVRSESVFFFVIQWSNEVRVKFPDVLDGLDQNAPLSFRYVFLSRKIESCIFVGKSFQLVCDASESCDLRFVLSLEGSKFVLNLFWQVHNFDIFLADLDFFSRVRFLHALYIAISRVRINFSRSCQILRNRSKQ